MVHPATRRRNAVEADLEDRGFTLESDGEATVAVDGPTEVAGVDAPLHLVYPADGSPLTVGSKIATAAHQGHVPVLITDQWLDDELRAVLEPPFLLASNPGGGRRFYNVEDRIRLTDDSFACLGTPGRIEWREPASDTDDPELVLEAGDEIVATLESVRALRCPGPEPTAFRYRYSRGDDGRLSVRRGEETVGRYTSFRSMRTDGFRPVPLPLVPEQHVRRNGHLARATLRAAVTDDGVEYRRCRSA
ncbi:hypothetical protein CHINAEXTREME_11845 [Halobiforma lacisalsi AJ5]|uniref:Uncharacterized protein n=1 Tax=Natronobacterium lacisalsi AJ5 TaxID=358396 RepID=M0LC26_NATLA|nr:hypothetical protein [Halobiforma lacisalsi]APW98432.1 hypothetical protein CHINAEXTREME_11845 [Halobiforma lacisalsi AJ5]EMA31117.1 hypothetical protein C445_15176 [Halobiforma lacisalsi AJ5]